MVTYRCAHSYDYEKINAFYNRIYNAHRTIEQFIWEFHECPFGKSIYVIAEDDGEIVGTNCVIIIDLITSDKKIIKSGKSEDTLVDPEYRGQNIFYKIYEFLFEKCREQNIQVIWGFTSAKKPFSNLGFEIPYDHQQFLSVTRIWKSFKFLSSLNQKNKIIDKAKILGLCVWSKAQLITKSKPLKLSYRIEKDDKIVFGVDDLIFSNQMRFNNSFAIHQSSKYQEWRIYDNPNYFKTHTFGVYDNDKLVALIIFNLDINDIAYICQSTFHTDLTISEKAKIIKSVTKMLIEENIVAIRTWVFDTNVVNSEEISIFNQAGYIHLTRGIGLVWKELSDTGLKPENFILSRMATQGVI